MGKYNEYRGQPWNRYRIYIIQKNHIRRLGKLIVPTLPIAINAALCAYPQLLGAQWGIVEELSPTPINKRRMRGKAVNCLYEKLSNYTGGTFCYEDNK